MKNEAKVMKKLKIKDWAELAKDKEKFSQYFSMLPELSEEIRLKVLDAIPEYIEFSKEVVQSIKYEVECIVHANTKTSDAIIESLNSIQKTLDSYANQENLTAEEKRYYCERQMELARMLIEFGKDNREFLKETLNSGLKYIGLALVSLVAIFAGAMIAKSNTKSDEADEDDEDYENYEDDELNYEIINYNDNNCSDEDY